MHSTFVARRHQRLGALIAVVAALLVLSASVGWARSTNGTWRLIDVSGAKPTIRKHSTLIYDAASKRVVMFGGDKTPSGAYSDVWAFDMPCGPWVQLFADNATNCSSTSRPCRRHGHAATYLPGSPAKMLIHGGKREDGVLIDDTWQMTLGTTPAWTRLSATTPAIDRWHASMVNFNGVTYFFGGKEQFSIGMCDTWAFGGSSWSYVSGNTTQSGGCGPTVPERRYHHSQIVDTGLGRTLVFGGEYEDEVGATSNVWWSANGSSWTPLGNAPTGYSRVLHTASYDPIAQRMIVIGGYDKSDGYQQLIISAVTSMSTSSAHYGAWSTLSPAGSGPGGIAEHAAAYDSDGDRILVFGGVDQNGTFRNDIWALEFADDFTPPAAVSNLQFTNLTPSSATIRWTVPGDDGTTGKACRYEIRYSLSAITDDASFAAATLQTNSPVPATHGTLQSTVIGGLSSGLVYYFAMKTSDEAGNVSSLSNVIATCIPYTPNTICDDFKAQPPVEGGGGGTQAQFGIRSLGSQPATLPLRVDFGLVRSGPVSIEMFDVTGRRVVQRDLGDLAMGDHSASLSAGSSIAAGLYVVRLRQGNITSTRRVVLLQ